MNGAVPTDSLVAELRRVFDSSEGMMLLAMLHGQVTVDGYVVKPTDDRRWSRQVLYGRMARMPGRGARLFSAGGTVDRTQVEA